MNLLEDRERERVAGQQEELVPLTLSFWVVMVRTRNQAKVMATPTTYKKWQKPE